MHNLDDMMKKVDFSSYVYLFCCLVSVEQVSFADEGPEWTEPWSDEGSDEDYPGLTGKNSLEVIVHLIYS